MVKSDGRLCESKVDTTYEILITFNFLLICTSILSNSILNKSKC